MAMAANAAGLIARFQGDSLQAKASHLQALAVVWELGSEIGIAYIRCCLGYADRHLGHVSSAARHFGDAASTLHEEHGISITSPGCRIGRGSQHR